MSIRLLAAVGLLLGGVPAEASAQEPAPADSTLPAVTVTASRTPVRAAEAPSRVTVLGREALERSASGTVADALEARSGVFVRRYGPGGLASVSTRGAGAAQTLVLLDGHRIADPQLGQLDWSLLPSVLLQGLEVLHGGGSALHGTDGLGGVVHLRTVRPGGWRLQGEAGAFGTGRASALGSLQHGPVGLVVAGEAARSAGDFPYPGRTGDVLRRANADRASATLFARAEGTAGATRGHLAAWWGEAERGVPGSVGAPLDTRQTDRHLRVWGGATTRFGWGTLRAGGLLQSALLRYEADEGRTLLASADVEARVPAGRWLLAGGATLGWGAADHPSLAADASEVRTAAWVSGVGDLGRLLLYPAFRADLVRQPDGQTLAALSPRLGANLVLLDSPGGTLRLKGAAGTAFRAPTFNDRFWQNAGGAAPGGDPNLRPERGVSADAGLHAQRGSLQGELTAYGAWTRDQIVWRPVAGGFYAPENLGRTRTLGLEASARWSGPLKAGPLGALSVDGGALYGLTDARDRSDEAATSFGQPLRYVPRHQLKAWAGLARGLGLQSTLRTDLAARWTSARPVRSDGSLWEPAYLVVDAGLSLERRFGAGTAALGLRVENLLDADYAVLRGYPMPPRHLRLRLTLTSD